MFWVWFIMVGIIGGWLAGKTTIPKLRKAAPLELLNAFGWISIICLVMIGILGIGRNLDSWFFHFLASTLSWAGIVSVPEINRRKRVFSSKEYREELEQEIAESKTNVPKVRTPNQEFMGKTSFEFPLAPPTPTPVAPKEELVDILAGSVQRAKTAYTYVEPLPKKSYLLDTELAQIREEFLGVLGAYCKANPSPKTKVEAEPVAVDVLAPAPPVPSLFSTPIVETGSSSSMGVTSRFGSTPSKTLAEPLVSADLDSTSPNADDDSLSGFTYKPKLIESKFSKPIE